MQESKTFKWLRSAIESETDGCIDWPFAKQSKGYGLTRMNKRTINAHRAACILAHGGPPFRGAMVLHSCGNRACVNPSHLRWGTGRQNAKDRDRDGNTARGEKNGVAILNDDLVRGIRARHRSGESCPSIAKDIGCDRTLIWQVVVGKRWAHVQEAQDAQ